MFLRFRLTSHMVGGMGAVPGLVVGYFRAALFLFYWLNVFPILESKIRSLKINKYRFKER
jgi:hypothetical protein